MRFCLRICENNINWENLKVYNSAKEVQMLQRLLKRDVTGSGGQRNFEI